mmetsp:Transcript_3392/g.5795  ORF Transcript_3392/g.5795 Transcript_3392/m.5795 type:complete len:172 (+) Transcript_3392:271-786(+)|eukprot:CAMPEP_0198207194 /NCGR_PEP_ID=MMETSP1445-20131203/10678_1 /TAXON_ID=36898 /ORGANISM="Pyramimonas sp., Strain CCMP2087" /LENGTH=171 /DNA_ID=CAMNT_0043880155 /DNA_START=238 /DNA_END=753 /DNA_ORIENTATION=-
MSHRRKHVLQEALAELKLPEADERILRVLSLRGSNIVEAELPDGVVTLCRMPQKFNKMLWVKKGTFVVVKLGDFEDKVNGEVVQVLYADHVKQFKKERGVWPPEFEDERRFLVGKYLEGIPPKEAEPSAATQETDCGDESESDDGLPPLEANTNHRRMAYVGGDTSSDEEV